MLQLGKLSYDILVYCSDIIMELRELSKLSEDYIAEMLTKLGLVQTKKINNNNIVKFDNGKM